MTGNKILSLMTRRSRGPHLHWLQSGRAEVRAAGARVASLRRPAPYGAMPQTAPAADGRVPPQDGAASAAAPEPRHMAPCVCHCAACRAAGNGNVCVVLRMGLLRLFHGKADIVDLVLRHYYRGASGWDTARLDAAICSIQYGPGGDVIAAGDGEGRIHFVCAQTGQKILSTLRGHDRKVMSVAWSPDGTRLASGSIDTTVMIWDAASGEQLRSLSCDSTVDSVVWSPDGTKIVAGSRDGKVRIFDSASGTLSGSPLTGHQSRVSSVHFSPDGKRLVSGSWDKTVMVWDPSTGEQLCQLRGENAIFSVAFSPDGQLIATGDGNPFNPEEAGTVKIYCASTGEVKRALNVGYAPFSLDLVLEFRWKIAVRFSIRFVKKSSQI